MNKIIKSMNFVFKFIIKIVNKLLTISFNTLFIPIWVLQRIIPKNENIWIFGGWHGYKYSDNARVFYEYVFNNEKSITPIWLTRRKEIVQDLRLKGMECYHMWSFKAIKHSLIAKYVFYSSYKKDINQFFINGAKIFHLYHGSPIKVLELDNLNREKTRIKLNLILTKYLFPFKYEYNISYFLSPAKIFSSIYCSAFDLPNKKILEIGNPRNDVFFSEKVSTKVILSCNSKFKNPKIIIYLPTYRDFSKLDILKSSMFESNEMSKFLEDINGVLIIKSHFVNKEFEDFDTNERIINLKNDLFLNTNDLLSGADILITDYSSVYFDFLLSNKPIIFFPFDLKQYTNRRKLYFDYEKVVAGPICYDWSEVRTQINRLIKTNPYVSLIKQKNELYNKFNDGKSSEKLFKFIKDL